MNGRKTKFGAGLKFLSCCSFIFYFLSQSGTWNNNIFSNYLYQETLNKSTFNNSDKRYIVALINCRCHKMSIIWRCDQVSVINFRMIIRRGLFSQKLCLISHSTLNVLPVHKSHFPWVLVCNISSSLHLRRRVFVIFVEKCYYNIKKATVETR